MAAQVINRMNLVSVRSTDTALELLGLLGYDRSVSRPYDLSDLGWEGVGTRLRNERSPARGYGVLVAEIPELPRSFKVLGRRIVELFHDRPLALIGIGEVGDWREWVLVRPRLVRGRRSRVGRQTSRRPVWRDCA